ncbi:Transcription termination factor Rho [Fusobacterium sp. DD29]|uniref:transcription termination factor Rho n=1 Tax=unclassified Fusobacterium TaxID=2648384 RepID=UPI001B8B3757|nr:MULTISPECIES: transcription termination factor Rho [unclassified Fusobacterium]MBR8701826.1 Transcription termination factor Rho [Fusobacterium sp. DD45]MBR8711600.1 Transcription termination factor Rho [Fusobacterium sp. DD28]MBR8749596.1 Transcription termination factor Rho [Fusobacterium sp. DD29]MBR8752149.1 Transcription termination factor Rho [Fusobacterium sp. DD26]MBR8761857.1 Transcription termination factor Rho [Fusobacterium sp. DD25]
MDKLDRFLLRELLEIAKHLGIHHKGNIKKNELKELIQQDIDAREATDIAWGTIDILQDGYGFLRDTSVEKDIYVSATQIRRFKMRTGDVVVGEVREPTGDEKNYALKRVLLINDKPLEAAESRVPFEELIPSYPTERFILETDKDNISGRIIDLVAPIGKGQRALIIAPPKAGKTVLISNFANSIMQTCKDAEVWILLIDERPEEVTDIRETVTGAKVFASTFDDDPRNHIKVTENILEQAKRKVEDGEHVVILMDSLTRLARAYNIVIPSSGKLLSGGIDPTALYYPKNFFGTARNIKGGGSLTIIATVLVDTGSKMDDIIYEEFKSTGNCDIHLDRTLAELRLFPAIDIQRSGTRKEELLLTKHELDSIWQIRRYLSKFDKAEALRLLVENLKSTSSNKSMLDQFHKGVKNEK